MSTWSDKDYEEKRGLVKLGVRVPKELVLELDRMVVKRRRGGDTKLDRTKLVTELLEKGVENG